MLWRHGGVSARHALRLAIVIAICLLRWPSSIVEDIRIGKRARAVRFDPPPLFIVGHWRSGTTFLQNVLSRDPQFCYPTLVEAMNPYDLLDAPWSPWLRRLLFRAFPDTRPMDDVPVRADLPMEEEFALAAMGAPSFINCFYFPRNLSQTFVREVMIAGTGETEAKRWSEALRYFLAKIAALHPGKRLLLKSPANSARVARLLQEFPDARFIHIHRDPIEVFRSSRRLYARMLPLLALQDYDISKIDEHIMRSYDLVMDRLREELPGVPAGRLCTVRYDNLVARPIETVGRIYRELDLGGFETAKPHMERFLAGTPVKPAPAVPLDAALERQLRERWRRHFDWLGYSFPQRAA
jgi:hypothetical protein